MAGILSTSLPSAMTCPAITSPMPNTRLTLWYTVVFGVYYCKVCQHYTHVPNNHYICFKSTTGPAIPKPVGVALLCDETLDNPTYIGTTVDKIVKKKLSKLNRELRLLQDRNPNASGPKDHAPSTVVVSNSVSTIQYTPPSPPLVNVELNPGPSPDIPFSQRPILSVEFKDSDVKEEPVTYTPPSTAISPIPYLTDGDLNMHNSRAWRIVHKDKVGKLTFQSKSIEQKEEELWTSVIPMSRN